jgi:hypothetical protein
VVAVCNWRLPCPLQLVLPQLPSAPTTCAALQALHPQRILFTSPRHFPWLLPILAPGRVSFLQEAAATAEALEAERAAKSAADAEAAELQRLLEEVRPRCLLPTALLHYCAALAASKPLHTRLLIQPSRFCVSCFGSPCFCFQSVPV